MHYVWGTKKRQPFITPELKPLLYEQIRQIAKENGFHLNFINGVADHVHLLFALDSVTTISHIPKMLKGASSRWVNENQLIEEHFEWQDGYGAFSVSPQNIAMVRNYIRNQEKHHQKLTFEQEIKILESEAKKYLDNL